MGISERLRTAKTTSTISDLRTSFSKPSGNDPKEDSTLLHHDPLTRIRTKAAEALYERLGQRLFDPNLTEDQLTTYVVRELDSVLSNGLTQLDATDRQSLVQSIAADILGLGPIEQFMSDPEITEVMVNGTDAIYVERAGRIYLTDSRFVAVEHLRRVIERIVSAVGRRIDESSPLVDARLPDGSRVNAVIPPLSVDGPMLTIRKFTNHTFTAEHLVNIGTLNDQASAFIDACVRGKRNILISGGTGTGKTTLLNVVSSFIPGDERIVTIEDAVELKLKQRHVIRLEARPANMEGRGAVPIRDLVKNSLRMRPDRIIVGEVRGGEALDMIQAMNTGHEGSLSTLHANSPRDALSRLETMILMSGMDLPMRAIREQVSSSLDMIIQLGRLRDGTRRVVEISEVIGMEGDTITLSTLFEFDFDAGFDEDGNYAGQIAATGLRPMFSDELRHMGVELPEDILGGGYQQIGLN